MFWAVAQTHPNAAGIACVNLHRQGFTYYNPLLKERYKSKRGLTYRTVQFFSNYIFVQIENQWRAVKSTKGILQLLTVENEKPAVVRDEFIADLKARENHEGLIVLGTSKFKTGNAVQIKSGPFAFQVGVFDGMSTRDRVFVLLSVLGTKRRVELLEDNLVAV